MATPTSNTPNKPQDFEESAGDDHPASTEPAQHNATSDSESLPNETESPEKPTVAPTSRKGKEPEDTSAPPLPNEEPPLPDEEPPLPDEEPPAQDEEEDDGWAPVWDAADLTPENHNDENKSKRQMNAFFDVDAAANSHDGRSLKAERSGKKLK
ncbi:hypothetical protein VF21_08973 [Pseudogymnoascus sp. 05NY08]|nr:hypothetical protein VF21_08973 [Pseudogymnoascus sp. 05NY08]